MDTNITVNITKNISFQTIKELVISLSLGIKYFYLPITLNIYVWYLIITNIYSYVSEVFMDLLSFRLYKYYEEEWDILELLIPNVNFIADCYDCKYLPFSLFTDMYCYYWNTDYYELQYYQFVTVFFGTEHIYNFKSVNYVFFRFLIPTDSFYFHYLLSYKTLFYNFSV